MPDARRILVRGRVRTAVDMPELLQEDYQPEKSNPTAIMRRLVEVTDGLLRRE